MIPTELQSLKQWCCYKLVEQKNTDKLSKLPINPETKKGAKSNDPSTWVDYEQLYYIPTNTTEWDSFSHLRMLGLILIVLT